MSADETLNGKEVIGVIPDDVVREFKGDSRLWNWVRVNGSAKAKNIVLEHDQEKITRLDFDGNFSRQEVLDAIYRCTRNHRERRKEAAKRGAETRKRRRASQDYAVAKAIVERKFTPRMHCACCQRFLTDHDSIKRGIGPECWEGIKLLIEQITSSQTQAAI